MNIVFLLEEKSMKALLDIVLPKILPPYVDFYTVPHEGKSDLQKSIPQGMEYTGHEVCYRAGSGFK